MKTLSLQGLLTELIRPLTSCCFGKERVSEGMFHCVNSHHSMALQRKDSVSNHLRLSAISVTELIQSSKFEHICFLVSIAGLASK